MHAHMHDARTPAHLPCTTRTRNTVTLQETVMKLQSMQIGIMEQMHSLQAEVRLLNAKLEEGGKTPKSSKSRKRSRVRAPRNTPSCHV